jgi:hypothetical protein
VESSRTETPAAVPSQPDLPPAAPVAEPPHAIATAPPVEARTNLPRILRAAPTATQPPPSVPATPPAAPEKIAALPPSETAAPRAAPQAAPAVPDTPRITVIRGGRQRAIAPRAPAAAKPNEHRRLAALPPGSSPASTASDAPTIIVLRGARLTRYALAARAEPPQPPTHPLLTVIRGPRPHLVRLQPYVQPGPLILRIPD